MPPGRTLSRWLSLCAAALVLVQLGSMAHLAAAPHGVCWEHGVLVDLDVASTGGATLTSSTGPGVHPAAGPALRSDGHPHCPALWLTRPARRELRASQALHVDVGHQVVIRGPAWIPPAAQRALRNAPKHSPPV